MSTFSLFFYSNLYFLSTFLLKSLLFYWNLYKFFTFLLQSLLSLYFSFQTSTFSLLFFLKSLLCLYFSFEISTFSVLFFWSLYFLFAFLLKSLLFYFFFWHLYWLFTCPLKPLLSLYFTIEISTFFLFAFLLKPLLSLYSSIEMRACTTFAPALHCEGQSSLASLNVTMHHICACTPSAPALHCEKLSCLASPNVTTQKFQRKTMPRIRGVRRCTRTQRLTPLAFATPCIQIYCEKTGVRTFPYFQTCTLSHACHTKCNLWPEPSNDWAIQLPVRQHYIAKSHPASLPPM